MSAVGYVWILIVAALASAAGTFVGRSAAAPLRLLDLPTRRKLHQVPVPAAGGFGILAGLVAGTWIATRHIGFAFPESIPGVTLAISAFAMFSLGTIDDRWRLDPRLKLIVQVAICVVAAWRGLALTHLPTAFGDISLGPFGIVLTTVWLVGMVNAINLIDGLDGLAAGIAGLMFAALAAVAVGEGPLFLGPLSVLVVGTVLGFLPFNLSQRRTFLGDGGSLLLGFLMAAIPLLAVEHGRSGAAWTVSLGFTAIPILDAAITIVRRRRRHVPVFRADAWHIHHRLLWLGLGPRGALLALLGLTTGIGLLAVAWVTGWAAVPLTAMGICAAGLIAARRAGLRFLNTATDLAALIFLARRPRNAARRFARDLRPVRESNPA